MKHILFAVAFFASIVTKSNATDTPIPSPVLYSFYGSFANAQDVSWEQNGRLTVASFTLQGQKKFAYFNEAARLVIVAEPITVNELPADLQASLRDNYGRYTVSDAFKLKSAHVTTYSIVLVSVWEKLFLRNSNDGWEVVKSTTK